MYVHTWCLPSWDVEINILTKKACANNRQNMWSLCCLKHFSAKKGHRTKCYFFENYKFGWDWN